MTKQETAAREAARRLVDLVQVLVPRNPGIAQAIERCVVALVIEDMRQTIAERLNTFSPEDVATVEALTAHLAARNHSDEAAGPTELP